jgi:hypothetical protein
MDKLDADFKKLQPIFDKVLKNYAGRQADFESIHKLSIE